MIRKILAGVVICSLIGASGAEAVGFSNANLNGPYVFQVHGVITNSAGEVGNLAINGLLSFNKGGAVTAIDLTITAADAAGDIENCGISGAANASLSSYSVSFDGSGTLNLGIPNGTCLNSSGGTQTIGFRLALPRAAAGVSRVMSNGTFGTLTDSFGQSIASLVLIGAMERQ